MRTSELVEDNFKGLSEFIKDKEILDFYKGLIVTVIEDRQEQAVNEALRMASEEASVDKHYNLNLLWDATVNKQSILSLAPKVLEKLTRPV